MAATNRLQLDVDVLRAPVASGFERGKTLFIGQIRLPAFPGGSAGDDGGEDALFGELADLVWFRKRVDSQLNHIRAGLGCTRDITLRLREIGNEDGYT